MTHDPYRVEPRKPRQDVVFRLWPKIDSGNESECWPFNGAKTSRGYGKIREDGKTLLAHRVMYAWAYGPIAPTDIILHNCDNPNCCNPAHLRRGTLSDNTQDMIAKGRHFTPWRGEAAKHSKLTEDAVKAIRASPLGYRKLSKQLGVSRSAIRSVRLGLTWRCVK
jgi:hypothetical protein